MAPSFATVSFSAALSFCRPRMRAKISSGSQAGQHDGLAVDTLEHRLAFGGLSFGGGDLVAEPGRRLLDILAVADGFQPGDARLLDDDLAVLVGRRRHLVGDRAPRTGCHASARR